MSCQLNDVIKLRLWGGTTRAVPCRRYATWCVHAAPGGGEYRVTHVESSGLACSGPLEFCLAVAEELEELCPGVQLCDIGDWRGRCVDLIETARREL